MLLLRLRRLLRLCVISFQLLPRLRLLPRQGLPFLPVPRLHVLLPHDDLALACALKSPLFGLNEEQLFELAWKRKASLRDSLRAKAKTDELFSVIDRELDALGDATKKDSPFVFFARVLGLRRGRAKFLSRLGPEANDALDEFLNLALDYESRETPSLQGFLAWLRTAQNEVRRDMEMVRDEVRVMTVHGAKGLEARMVILADTITEPKGAHPPKLLSLANGAVVWATRKQDDTEAMTQARHFAENAALDEYRRLLYVAMTRAAERLIVCGTKGKNKIPDGCWYQLVDDALRADCVTESADDGEREVLRYRKSKLQLAEIAPLAALSGKQMLLPAWLKRDVAPDPETAPTITPSNVENDDATRPVTPSGDATALLRGRLVHRLIQSLPDVPRDRRAQATANYLARAGRELDVAACSSLTEQVMLVLEDPRFAELFAPGSRAEVPIVGQLKVGGKTVRVSGQVDRLAVTQNTVLIGDFKTNRPAPRRIAEVPTSYVRQLALYRALLEKIYPGRLVRAALVWTEVPELMELSAADMDAALARVTSV